MRADRLYIGARIHSDGRQYEVIEINISNEVIRVKCKCRSELRYLYLSPASQVVTEETILPVEIVDDGLVSMRGYVDWTRRPWPVGWYPDTQVAVPYTNDNRYYR